MRIEVRFFASLADCTGRSTESVVVDPATDVSGLWQLLARRHPALSQIGYRPMVACDQVYADWDQGLEGVREVAFLPPVSGG